MTSAPTAERQRLLAQAEAALEHYLPQVASVSPQLDAAMRHALNAGGKRLRPILCLAAAEAVRPGSATEAERAAVALECIHTYSLIHDDLPCMDNADTRRGQPTVHRLYDEATAVLAGDALLAHAFALTADHAPELARDLTRLLAQAAGPSALVGGQMEDTLGRRGPATPDRLASIQRGKTAAMLSASLAMGARVGGSTATEIFWEAGQTLGVAFQIADDLLDLEGNSTQLGKPTGSDAEKGKLTYHSLHGVEAARKQVVTLTDATCASLKRSGASVDLLVALVKSLVDRKN